MDKQIEFMRKLMFMRKLIRDVVEDARLHNTSMASIIGNGCFVAEQIMNDVYNQALEDFATALLDGEQNEEFVYNIEKIVERLRK